MTAPVVDLSCPGCGERFKPKRSMAGGFAACPRCRRAVAVPSRGPEPLFWALLGLGVVVTIAVAVVIGNAAGPGAAVAVLAVGAIVITIAVVAS